MNTMRLALGCAAAFALSPFALLAFGGLPVGLDWRIVAWIGFFVAGLAVGWRALGWPALGLWAGAGIVWLVVLWLAVERYYPCWPYSNAAWCGHFCDDDPCACPERSQGAAAYGAGHGCTD